MRQFPLAAHPEIMRAQQKDEQYITHLCETFQDIFRRCFGTSRALAHHHKTQMVGQALYYYLTTGLGVQTLGEEYSNITQVAGQSGLLPNPASRTLLVFLQTILPYLAERLSVSAALRGMLLANPSSSETPVSPNISNQSRRRPLEQIRRMQIVALQHWPTILPSLREALMLLNRAHLMLFYFKGVYYSVAKHVVGIQYAFMGKPPQQRTRYHMLGVFLLIQLCITGGHWLWHTMLPTLMTSMQSHSLGPSTARVGRQAIQILDEDEIPVSESSHLRKYDMGKSIKNNGENVAASKCPLCLSSRLWPTATPCGHVFCWNCVAEWCNEKLECPLCRSRVTHAELVPIFNADF